MSCKCTPNTLRTFIRSLAHIDIYAGPKCITFSHASVASHSLRFQRPFSARVVSNIGSKRLVQLQDKAPDRTEEMRSAIYQRRYHSVGVYNAEVSSAQDCVSSKGHNVAGPDLEPVRTRPLTIAHSSIVDLSPAAIEALSVEVRQEKSGAVSGIPLTQVRYTDKKSDRGITSRRKVPTRDQRRSDSESGIAYRSLPRQNKEEQWKSGRRMLPTIRDVHRPRTFKEPWQSQKAALQEKFGTEGWSPRKKLSPDALTGIRALHAQFPEQYTLPVLAAKFEVSPEAIRRILRSTWTPTDQESDDRKHRWFARGEKVWSRYAELGLKPPKRWREAGVPSPKSRADRAITTTRSEHVSWDQADGIASQIL